MMLRTMSRLLLASAALSVAACGGGGGGINFTPAPPENPEPPPPPPPPPPLPDGPIGLISDQPFATVSARTDGWGSLSASADEVEISYSAADDTYAMTIPGAETGELAPPKLVNGSYDEGRWTNVRSTVSDLFRGPGPEIQATEVTLDWPGTSEFEHTSFGSWHSGAPMGEPQGVFAYGTSTTAGEMPGSGSASYSGEIRGITDGLKNTDGSLGPVLDVFGSVSLSFDFGAGTLAGEMEPQIAPYWEAVSLGTYTFRDTLYSPGSTTFSGAFDVPGVDGPSSFSGSFTGPGAAELMAWWQAPFLFPDSTAVGSMSGVWIAKRP